MSLSVAFCFQFFILWKSRKKGEKHPITVRSQLVSGLFNRQSRGWSSGMRRGDKAEMEVIEIAIAGEHFEHFESLESLHAKWGRGKVSSKTRNN
jgi:hypothetical protein